jgi:hypothetical protein
MITETRSAILNEEGISILNFLRQDRLDPHNRFSLLREGPPLPALVTVELGEVEEGVRRLLVGRVRCLRRRVMIRREGKVVVITDTPGGHE